MKTISPNTCSRWLIAVEQLARNQDDMRRRSLEMFSSEANATEFVLNLWALAWYATMIRSDEKLIKQTIDAVHDMALIVSVARQFNGRLPSFKEDKP